MTDSFSIENMKAELARATNKQADITKLIDDYLESNTKHTDAIDKFLHVIDVLKAVDARNSES